MVILSYRLIAMKNKRMPARRINRAHGRPSWASEPPPATPCPICDHPSYLFDVVDFNKSCIETEGKFLPLSGQPVYYVRCDFCGFVHAPQLYLWSPKEFRDRIYNDGYEQVDPNYLGTRAKQSAQMIEKLFGLQRRKIRHLDYGGGSGALSKLLCAEGWSSETFDPFGQGNNAKPPVGQYDLISVVEVFEHAPWPQVLVNGLKKLLAPEGILLLTTVVSDQNILPGKRLTWWYASPRNGHISLFSLQSLALLFAQHNLTLASANGNVHLAYGELPLWAAALLKNREGAGVFSRVVDSSQLRQGAEAPVVFVIDGRSFDATGALALATSFLRQSQYQLAEKIVDAVLSKQVTDARANHLKGLILHHREADNEAAAALCRSVSIAPSVSEYWSNYGIVLKTLGRRDEAEQAYRKALVLSPQSAPAMNNLALLIEEKSDQQEAEALLRSALEIDNNYADAHLNLGNLLFRQRRIVEAEQSYRQAIEKQPGFVKAWYQYARLLSDRHDNAATEAACRKALTYDPAYADGFNLLGITLHALGRLDEAVTAYQEAIRLNPADSAYWNNLGNLYREDRLVTKALAAFEQSLQLDPSNFRAHNNLGVLFQQLGDFYKARHCFDEAIRLAPEDSSGWTNLSNLLAFEQRYVEADEASLRGIELNPGKPEPVSQRLFILAGRGDIRLRELFEAHRAFGEMFEQDLPPRPPLRHRGASGERIRIGYISADFRQHPVAYFMRPVLANHNSERFDIYCYSNYSYEDRVTASLKELPVKWRKVFGLSDNELFAQVRDDSIDILVDLSGHTSDNRLPVFIRRPAPVQVSWLGYPATTGLKSIDYFLADAYTDPPGESDAYHTETIWRLPGSFAVYQGDADCPDVGELPALRCGFVTFGSFNHVRKLTAETIALWARVIAAVPTSRLLLKDRSLSDEATRKMVTQQFVQAGVTAARLILLPRDEDYRSHMSRYNEMDIALDTFPYNGTTTTCDATWMGVPVITLIGDRRVSRMGYSIAMNVGLDQVAAATQDDFVEKAKRLAGDLSILAAIRATLRQKMKDSPLGNPRVFLSNLENAYLKMLEQVAVEKR
jgi:protein O-GlcNAc transferase